MDRRSSQQKQQQHQHRRTFRGRGGPTDGRLPKHNASRRRRLKQQQQQEQPEQNCVDEVSSSTALDASQTRDETLLDQEATADTTDVARDGIQLQGSNHNTSIRMDDDVDRDVTDDDDTDHSEFHDNGNESCRRLVDPGNVSPPIVMEEESSAFPHGYEQLMQEMNHLMKRIRNNRESIRLSSASSALDRLSTYKTNVLGAVRNCVKEWKAIIRRYVDLFQWIHCYGRDDSDNGENGGIRGIGVVSPAQAGAPLKEASRCSSLAVFELIQQALQCGPLAGSQPGYFKRCGSDVARIVLEFLNTVVPTEKDALDMYLTEKQVAALEKWKVNAQKAVDKDQSASKSVSKKEQKANRRKDEKLRKGR